MDSFDLSYKVRGMKKSLKPRTNLLTAYSFVPVVIITFVFIYFAVYDSESVKTLGKSGSFFNWFFLLVIVFLLVIIARFFYNCRKSGGGKFSN